MQRRATIEGTIADVRERGRHRHRRERRASIEGFIADMRERGRH
eukprot:SAG31_NODE_30153_length_384_cov_5.042105_1_plen_43_part_10